MRFEVVVNRFLLIFSLATCNYVKSEGTLYIKLLRYQNDTCGGFIQDSGFCDYSVALSIETAVYRGYSLLKTKERYQLTPLGGTFTSTQYDIKFFDLKNLGPLPNPIPIRVTRESPNFTLVVDNALEQIFKTTYTFDLGTLMPNVTVPQHDGFNNTGIFDFTYKLECDRNFVGTGCLECEEGMFGMKCEVRCQENMNFTCHPDTGNKICRDHHYGDECERYCEDTETFTCTNHGNKLCVYPVIGEECNKETTCPENRFGSRCDVTCSPIPGQFLCSENGTRVCEGHFTGPDCKSCTQHHYGPECNITCVPHTKRYTCSLEGARVCQRGWTGAQCAQCGDSWFGENCDIHCEMSNRYTCTYQGQKVCQGNWDSATNCSSCKKHFYGSNCEVYCKKEFGRWKCDKTTGEKICLPSTNRAGGNCTECKQDYYQDDKTSTCKYCKETERYTCGEAGEKRCKQSWYGEECRTQCQETTRNSCHPKDGTMICKSYYAGKDCQGCIDRHYGETCDVYCVETKRNDCNATTGAKVCKKDYFGPNCQTFCDTSSSFYSCDSYGIKKCKGNRNITTDCELCDINWYGANCDTHCTTSHPRTQCAQNGSLICVEGWAGEQCSECAPNWYGSTCDGSGWSWYDESGTCRKTCDMFCVDMLNFKCNKDGILEMNPEFAGLYNDYYELKITGIISGFVLVYLVSVLFLYKLCFVWYPAKESI